MSNFASRCGFQLQNSTTASDGTWTLMLSQMVTQVRAGVPVALRTWQSRWRCDVNLDEMLEGILATAKTLLDEAASEGSKEKSELARQVLALDEWLRQGGKQPQSWGARQADLEQACRGLLQDVNEIIERQGEEWWDETVTAGLHHRNAAEEHCHASQSDAPDD